MGRSVPYPAAPALNAAPAVTIVIDGSIIAGFVPARISGGRVVAPLTPVVVALAMRVAYDALAGTVTLERGALRIVVPVVGVEADIPLVALEPIVRGLGENETFDAASKTLAIAIPALPLLEAPTPAAAGGMLTPPTAEPTAGSKPSAVPTPARSVEPGVPRPRRTAIPAVPSEPVGPTSRRRSGA